VDAGKLIIVGAGGLGREYATWAKAAGFEVTGFLDRDSNALQGTRCSLPILGNEDDYEFAPDDRCILALGDPKVRARVAESLVSKVEFATVIHPAAIVGDDCRIGHGTVVCPGAVLTADVDVGIHAVINIGAVLGHDVTMGDFCTLCPHADIMGHVTLGDSVFLGTQAVIIPSMTIGDSAIVGAGAVVIRPVAEGATVVGNPAKPL